MKRRMPRSLLRDYGLTVTLAVGIALLIRFFVIEAYRIPSGSMRPTLEPGDVIFVTKYPFGLRLPGATEPLTRGRVPRIGEVVVYAPPGEGTTESIKRVAARSGDRVELKGGRLRVNGKELSAGVPGQKPCGAEAAPDGTSWNVCWDTPPLENTGPLVVPEGQVFLIGDARSQNTENRGNPAWAMVPLSGIRGQAAWIWLSLQPTQPGNSLPLFSRIRFERMFRRI